MDFYFLLDAITAGVLISLILMVWRIWRSQFVPDRVVVADQISIHMMALIALHAIRTRQEAYLDILIVFSMLGFLSTITLARYFERLKD